jgi:hypothetical protein
MVVRFPDMKEGTGGGIPCLIAATGLCTQNDMNACKEAQSTIHLPQIPHGK